MIEPVIEGVVGGLVAGVSEFVGHIAGDAAEARLSQRKRCVEAYGRSLFCRRCPGTAKDKRAKLGWYVYRCQDCGSRWGVLKEKPWVRREKRERAGETRAAA